jgi:hypothetical protein
MRELREAENELFEKIEALKKSIEHQKDTLVNWREEDNSLQSATDYRNEMIEDMHKLDILMDSYILVLKEMIKTI